MAMQPWAVRGTLTTTTTTTLHTVTNPEKVIVTNIVLCNYTASNATATLDLDGVVVVSGTVIPAHTTTVIDMKQPLITSGSNKLIRGGSDTATAITYHVAGVTY